MMSRLRLRLAVALVVALTIAGCAGFFGSGMVTLKEKRVTSLEVSLAGLSNGLCPGRPTQVLITAVLDSGERLTSWVYDPMGRAEKKGHLDFEEFGIVSTLGAVQPEGLILVDHDPLATWGKAGTVTVTYKFDQRLTASMPVKPDYTCQRLADFGGAHGPDGLAGQQGADGSDGKSEQSSGPYSRPGGNGEDGVRGADGGLGGQGQRGLDVQVSAAPFVFDGKQALLVRVASSAGLFRYVYLRVPGQKFLVRANGGDGGNGGNGGNGGVGGDGGTGKPAGNGGRGGDGGNGGNGGNGGDGGRLRLVLDPAHRDLANELSFESQGGRGGQPGQAGFGASGGTVFSGAEQGASGRPGTAGTVYGQNGRDGGPVQVEATGSCAALFADEIRAGLPLCR
jgi:hypothetical protein